MMRVFGEFFAGVLLAAMVLLAVAGLTALASSQAQAETVAQQAVEHVETLEKIKELAWTPSLKDTAEQALIKLINAATEAGEFIADQVPLVVQELIVYSTVKYSVLLLLVLAAYTTAVYVGAKFHDDSDGIVWVPVGAVIVIGSPAVWVALDNLLMLVFAPRVWLLEYAAKLV